MMNKEIRCELTEFITLDDNLTIEGKAIAFNEPKIMLTHNSINYYEQIDANALNNTNFKKCCLKYNHKDEVPILARTRGDSLQLIKQKDGLYFRAKMFDTTVARDLYTIIKQGGLDQVSFGFILNEQNGERFDRATKTRTILNIDYLVDISLVDNGAYGDSTNVNISLRNYFTAQIELEEKLRNEDRRKKLILKTYF